jgi:hypothetical protein
VRKFDIVSRSRTTQRGKRRGLVLYSAMYQAFAETFESVLDGLSVRRAVDGNKRQMPAPPVPAQLGAARGAGFFMHCVCKALVYISPAAH